MLFFDIRIPCLIEYSSSCHKMPSIDSFIVECIYQIDFFPLIDVLNMTLVDLICFRLDLITRSRWSNNKKMLYCAGIDRKKYLCSFCYAIYPRKLTSYRKKKRSGTKILQISFFYLIDVMACYSVIYAKIFRWVLSGQNIHDINSIWWVIPCLYRLLDTKWLGIVCGCLGEEGHHKSGGSLCVPSMFWSQQEAQAISQCDRQ